MSTAESMIKEYLNRGHSLEALRLLAESRPHPLGGEMLAIIDAMEAAAEPVTCETGSFASENGDVVFFVADDEEVMAGEGHVDFDVMAETGAVAEGGMAATDESVSDILVETAARPVAFMPDQLAEEASGIRQEHSEMGIWSRFWSRMRPGETPVLTPADNAGREAAAGSVEGEAAGGESIDSSMPDAEVLREFFAPETAFATEEIFEPEHEAAESAMVAGNTDTGEVFETGAQGDVSADYIPGSVSEVPEKRDAQLHGIEQDKALLLEAQKAINSAVEREAEPVVSEENGEEPAAEAPATQGSIAEEPVAEKPVAENPVLEEPVAEAAPAENTADVSPVSDKTSRKERRRRERAQKKKEKRAKKSATTLELPEIVLTRSEDNEMMLPEQDAPEMESVDANILMAAADQSSVESMEHGELSSKSDFAGGDDHLMIVAGGGYDLTELDHLFIPQDSGEEENAEAVASAEDAGANNIILFHERFSVFAGDALHSDHFENDEQECFAAPLRVLPSAEMDEEMLDEPAAGEADSGDEFVIQNEVAENKEQEPPVVTNDVVAITEMSVSGEKPEGADEVDQTGAALKGDVLTLEERLCLLRAFGGRQDDEDIPAGEPAELFEDEHLIMSLEPERDSASEMLEREAAVRSEMEREYQTSLDEFAGRILQVQAVAAASEARVREKQSELEAKDAIIAEMQNRLAAEEKKQLKLNRDMDDARREIGARQAEIERIKGVQDEHGRLYAEFEDLRKAYNEVVTDVMPGLQGERDDLAMTVERQCQKEKKLRESLTSSRRRLAVGYALGAAACVMLVALPVVNWLKSGEESRALARDHQMVSELTENYNSEVKRVIELQKTIVDLEREVESKNAELASVQSRNREMAGSTGRNQSNLAVFPPPGSGQRGTPTRTSTMALQATDQPNGQLRVNQIRDPEGSIESIMAQNQVNQSPNAPRMARSDGNRNGRISVSSVASREPRQAPAANNLRPGSAPAGGMRPPQAQASSQRQNSVRTASAQSQPARRNEVVAKVKKGEGVAQVVYRVLGTRDPEVIAWVIRENNIKPDRRGNPIIQPDQQLRLPKDGNAGQAASAAGRR